MWAVYDSVLVSIMDKKDFYETVAVLAQFIEAVEKNALSKDHSDMDNETPITIPGGTPHGNQP